MSIKGVDSTEQDLDPNEYGYTVDLVDPISGKIDEFDSKGMALDIRKVLEKQNQLSSKTPKAFNDIKRRFAFPESVPDVQDQF